MLKLITSIHVYWGKTDKDQEGWLTRWIEGGHLQGPLPVGIALTATLDEAIDQACYDIRENLTHDDFACLPNVDGGFASWEATEHEDAPTPNNADLFDHTEPIGTNGLAAYLAEFRDSGLPSDEWKSQAIGSLWADFRRASIELEHVKAVLASIRLDLHDALA